MLNVNELEMDSNQYMMATGCLSGVSLLFHVMSAGNFLPDEEVWLLGTVFWYVHYWLNIVARLSLLSTAAMIALEIYAPNMITSYTSVEQRKLKKYLTKMLIVATFCVFIRFVLPGPVTSFSIIYKLGFMTCLSAAVITVVEVSQAGGGSPIKRRWGVKKREGSEDDEDERRRRSAMPKNSSEDKKYSFKEK